MIKISSLPVVLAIFFMGANQAWAWPAAGGENRQRVDVAIVEGVLFESSPIDRSIEACRNSLTSDDWKSLAPVITPDNLSSVVTQLGTGKKSDLTQALLEECLFRHRGYFRFCAIHINEMAAAAADGTLCSLTPLSVTPMKRP